MKHNSNITDKTSDFQEASITEDTTTILERQLKKKYFEYLQES